MKVKRVIAALVGALSLIAAGCGSGSLMGVIKRDMVLFEEPGVPDSMVSLLSDSKVVVLGEYHEIREHKEFERDLTEALCKKADFGKLLIEFPQAYSWMIEDFAVGKLDELNSLIKANEGIVMDKVRFLNASLPAERKIMAYGVDVNHHPAYYTQSLSYMRKVLEYTEPIDEFLQSIQGQEEKYQEIFMGFAGRLADEHDLLIEKWGEKWYRRIMEITDIEIKSMEFRKEKENNYESAERKREDIIKGIVERRISEDKRGALINVGLNHAQKKHFRGTANEWLGDYLVNKSPFAAGKTYSIAVMPAKGEIEVDGPGSHMKIDLEKDKGLFGMIYRLSGDSTAFLPMDDKIFMEESIKLNFHYQNSVMLVEPKEQFDGIVILPESHPYR